ncbi:MAG TPA: NUDIX hydrolase [Cyclobacteriaceae bacterium]|jgi:8-oxo-dGTP pyrophosphatase MutT (NUDIX family)|nr:NUDIX hydrolase [Cyclobacteriaceae bacterium]
MSKWTTLTQEDIYENPWIKLEEHQVINPAGGKGIYGKVHYKNIAIGIVALDSENNTWLVGQHRYPLDEWSWEIPEGGGPIGKDMLESAKRELAEETGLNAKQWQVVLKAHLSNSVSDEVAYIFLAQGLREGEHEREATEADMQVKKVPFKEALDLVMEGKITDAMSVMGILKVARMLGM